MCVFGAGEEVKLSSFGTFSVQSKNERIGRNPKTGIEAVTASCFIVSSFTYSQGSCRRPKIGTKLGGAFKTISDLCSA